MTLTITITIPREGELDTPRHCIVVLIAEAIRDGAEGEGGRGEASTRTRTGG